MPPQPTGTVTFLFTDIEGSTSLLQALGDDRAAQVFEEHHRLLRAAFSSCGGHVIETQGDAFLVGFQSAHDALLCAVDGQRALRGHRWPEKAGLRVRMGLNTAETVSESGGYVGLGIHRTARICSIGWGGQILVSGITHDILDNDLPGDVVLRDLGEHRLKDLQRPERIYQALHPDLPVDFPTLRSLERYPHNLPYQLTSFIGRQREMVEVKRLLTTTRLLTLTGSGGCGKTRLALQVAADLVETYADGVWLVELAPVSDPALVAQTVAAALGVREQPGRPILATLATHLQPKRLLLVLDNCEHLIHACAELAEDLLKACPELRSLATSREQLAIAGETVWRVPSLPLPDLMRLPPLENLAQYEAVRLFIERAIAALPDFQVTNRNAPSVAHLCHRLDGIPLAIELAAARVKVLPVDQILTRLNDRFRLLVGGGRTAGRQQTLRATMDWSHDLLSSPEQVLLRRLSVFAGGWTLPAAEAVCAGDGIEASEVLDLLTRLVDKSLVMAVVSEGASAEARYWLLESVRQYAAEKFAGAGEESRVRRQHRDFFRGLVERAEPELRGTDQAVWIYRLKLELDNIRAALEWSKHDNDVVARLLLVGSLWWFWFTQGTLNEGRAWLEGALAASTPAAGPPYAGALYGAGAIAWSQGDLKRAAELAAEALVLVRELNDRLGILYCQSILGAVQMIHGAYAGATAMLEEALALSRDLGDRWATATVLGLLGWVAFCQGDPDRASTLSGESLTLFRGIGDIWGAAGVLGTLGLAAWVGGNLEQAPDLLEESVTLSRKLGNRSLLARSLHGLALVAAAQAHLDRATALEKESLTLRRDEDELWGVAESLEGFAAITEAQGYLDRATRLHGAAQALREAIGVPLPLVYQEEINRTLSTLKARLGPEHFSAILAAGRGMPAERAVELALESP